MDSAPAPASGIAVGRYVLYDQIAAGGMASVHIARLLGPAGFSRTVAIKRLHAAYAKDPAFVAMFLDEARLAARIRHPNVVSTLDVAATQGELFLVMDYVSGESLSKLRRSGDRRFEAVPVAVASSILIGVLYGLHAAHDATGEGGELLGVVHRDVSPHNVLVGVDGVARVVDFGIAKAVARLQSTADGQIKGKLAYMSPEQLNQGRVDRRADVFSASVVLWEALTGHRLFAADDPGAIANSVLHAEILPPSRVKEDLPRALDDVVLRGLARDPNARFSSAREMLLALEGAITPASPAVVGDWVKERVGAALERWAKRIGEIETSSLGSAASGVKAATGSPIEIGEAVRRRASTLTAPVEMVSGEPRNAPTTVDAGSPPAQATDASLATPVRTIKSEWRRPLSLATVAAAGVAVTLAGVAVALAATGFRLGSPEGRSENATPAAPSTPGAAAAGAAAGTSLAPPASEAPQPDPSSSAAPSATARPTAASPTAGVPPVSAPRRRLQPASDCDPPYVWDAVRRIRVYKKQCQ